MQQYQANEYARRKLREALFKKLEVQEPKVCKVQVPVNTTTTCVSTSSALPVTCCTESDSTDNDCPNSNLSYSPYGDCIVNGKPVLKANDICQTLCYKNLTKALSKEQEAKQNLDVYCCPDNLAKYELAKDNLLKKQTNMIEYLLKKKTKTKDIQKTSKEEVQNTIENLAGGERGASTSRILKKSEHKMVVPHAHVVRVKSPVHKIQTKSGDVVQVKAPDDLLSNFKVDRNGLLPRQVIACILNDITPCNFQCPELEYRPSILCTLKEPVPTKIIRWL